jgi:CRP-like cAMP-binding protein
MSKTDVTPNAAAEVLATVSYFDGLDAPTLTAVARAAVRRDYGADQVVFLEGETCNGLYAIQAGWLKAIKLSPAGREQVLHFLGPGEAFNILCVLVGTPNPATVVALEPATVWIVPRETMARLLGEQPGLAWQVIQDLAGRLLHLVALVEDLSLHSVETRLARLLLEQAQQGVVPRRRWATQAELAARLGTVPDVLHRALRGLVEAGLIQVERHLIQILDPQGLAAKAEPGE